MALEGTAPPPVVCVASTQAGCSVGEYTRMFSIGQDFSEYYVNV